MRVHGSDLLTMAIRGTALMAVCFAMVFMFSSCGMVVVPGTRPIEVRVTTGRVALMGTTAEYRMRQNGRGGQAVHETGHRVHQAREAVKGAA